MVVSGSITSRPPYILPRPLIQAGGITIPEVFEWNARENPDHPLFSFLDDDGGGIHNVIYSEAIRGIRAIAKSVQVFAGNTETKPIAILANADTITYSLTIMGILLAGHIAFPVSSRNGLTGVVDLLRRTKCKHVLISEDDHIRTLAGRAVDEVDGLAYHPLMFFDDLFSPSQPTILQSDLHIPTGIRWDSTAVILHSSGSTNHPKPIYWTHEALIKWVTVIWHGEIDTTAATIGCHGIPMFHALGVSTFFSALCSGWILSVFKPSYAPRIPTPDVVFTEAAATACDYIITVPSFIEEWARDAAKVARMMDMEGLMFGGATLNQELGDMLASKGISLITLYGITEIGSISHIIPANRGMDWPWFSITPILETVQRDTGDGKYECIVLSTPDRPLMVVNTKIGTRDAYATNDLLEAHPTKRGLWKVHGRQDDQIVLSNGEKTNPIPLEQIISEDLHVQASLVFGQGQFQNGVLIDPKPEFRIDPQDSSALEQLRNKIWGSVERANGFSPQHSRIFKEMILVTSPDKPFTYNMKGYPRRGAIVNLYAPEIELLYANVEQSSQGDIPIPRSWSSESALEFIRAVAHNTVQRPLADDADLFRNGCDSLQATWIRNTILRALRQLSPLAAKGLSMNVVFEAPSIAALARAVLRATEDTPDTATVSLTTDDLVRLAEQYSSGLPSHPSQLSVPGHEDTKDVVLLTGSTSGFGCDILEHLLLEEGVSTIYAFNRKRPQPVTERQQREFRERGLQEGLLSSSKLKIIEVDLTVPGFGVDAALLEEIRCSITHILHNAWHVDFNMTLSSFEPDLKGVRNLIELSLASPRRIPPKILYVSSIGVLRNCTLERPIPEVSIEPSAALGSGYSESKWIAEQILHNAAERTGLPVTIVRLGQLCGDRNGHWNEKEWFPALVKSAIITLCLPDVKGMQSFIPSYPAARTFVEMRSSTARVLHLIHPRPIPWHDLITPISETLSVPLVSYSDWLNAVEKTANAGTIGEIAAMRQNPVLRLLDFFRAQSLSLDKEPLGAIALSTQGAERASQTLASLPSLNTEDSKAWVATWQATGFLPR